MSTTMLRSTQMPTTVTTQHTHAAAALVAACHPDRADIQKAVSKAAELLPILDWQYDGGVLRIASESRPHTWHFAEPDYCPCEARKFCWHKGAALLVQAIHCVSTMPEPKARPAVSSSKRTLEELEAETDQWF